MTHHDVIVIGGGNAGLSIAGRLRRSGIRDVAVIEPRETHIFRPLQSHIAGGVARASEAIRPQADVFPSGVEWVRDAVTDIHPDERAVSLKSGGRLTYGDLIVCPGMVRDWDAIPGLDDAMAAPEGVSNYEFDLAQKASVVLRDTTGGTVVFVESPQPSSCAGAGQKPMYLACDWWRSRGVLDDIHVILVRPEPTMFHVPAIDAELQRKVAEYGIDVRYDATLVSIDPGARTATIARAGEVDALGYDVLHVEPPQKAPLWLAQTSIAGPDGFVDIDPRTFRHREYPNVWSLGDAAATDSYKSGGAIRTQAKMLTQNLTAARKRRDLPARYNGYGVCPFTVSRSTVVFAEFDRDGALKPTVPFWKTLYRERRFSWVADRRILPWVYWHLILRGLA